MGKGFMKEIYNYIFIVLVYRNTDDLLEFIESANRLVPNFKIVVVNSYYDETTRKIVQSIAERNNCDFINVENKGYSFGNNVGIEYAAQKYTYKYLIVSNPDIVIKKFDFNPDKNNGDIIAPYIVAASGKQQNPMMVRRIKMSEWLIYHGFKDSSKILLTAGIAINKISREFALRINRNCGEYQIYCAHGSFLLLSSKAIQKLGVRPYDENMFLFAEESVLARQAEKKHLKTVYSNQIQVFHKEDGSMKLGGIVVNKELAKANVYYYEHYVKEN